MPGPTPFTRAAGAMTLATVPLLALMLVLAMGSALIPALMLLSFLVLAAIFVCTLVGFVGLLVRHRGCWWVWPEVGLIALSLVAMPWDRAVADAAAIAAALLLAWGVVAAGRLSRSAAVALAVGTVGGIVFGESLLGVLTMFVGVGGMFGLAWAMWREPLHEGRAWQGNVVVPAPPA